MVVEVAWIQAGGETAEQARRMVNTLMQGRSGILTKDGLKVTESGTPAMTVDVAAGPVLIPGDEQTGQGTYWVDVTASDTLAVAAADDTDDRIDLVEVRVLDSDYSGTDDKAELHVVTGTAAESPEAPTPSDNAWVLAEIAVTADATSITDADITDKRRTATGQTGRVGGIFGISAAATTTAQNLTTSDADIAGATTTFTTTQDNALALVMITADMESIATTIATGEVWLTVDGTDQSAHAMFNGNGATSEQATPGQCYLVMLASADSHTLKLRGKAGSNSTVRTRSVNTTLVGLVIDTGQGFS